MKNAPRFFAILIIVHVLAFFLLMYGARLLKKLVDMIPGVYEKQNVIEIAAEIEQTAARYFTSVTLINAALGLSVWISVGFLGLPHPLLWGIKSTIDFFQSSFSEFLATRSSRIAVTSTVSAGAAAGEAEAAIAGETADAAGLVAEGAVADSIVVFGAFGGVSPAGGAGYPNILDIRLFNIPIITRVALSQEVASCFSTLELV
jgi:hypothetical protein